MFKCWKELKIFLLFLSFRWESCRNCLHIKKMTEKYGMLRFHGLNISNRKLAAFYNKLIIMPKMVELNYSSTYWHNGLSVQQCSGRPVFDPRSSHTKDSKIAFDTSLTLSIRRIGSRVSGATLGKKAENYPTPRYSGMVRVGQQLIHKIQSICTRRSLNK